MSVEKNYVTLSGFALGTSFIITYKDKDKRDFYDSITRIFDEFENSLSIYRENSIISKVNRDEQVNLDEYFINMFDRARNIWEKTNGAFDISASPIFEIWGWGAKEKVKVTQDTIDYLMQFVGMDKLHIKGQHMIKNHPNVTLNPNAIAKGYSSDIIARFLDRQGINNYMVYVGGEDVLKGVNKEGNPWRIGIEKPVDGNMVAGQYVQTILSITDRAIATSGDYRRFYIEDGKKYSHTIDPKTGYSARQNVLSATVIAEDCMTADALATAFMVMGVEETKEFLTKNPGIEVYLIYSEEGELKEYFSKTMKGRVVK